MVIVIHSMAYEGKDVPVWRYILVRERETVNVFASAHHGCDPSEHYRELASENGIDYKEVIGAGAITTFNGRTSVDDSRKAIPKSALDELAHALAANFPSPRPISMSGKPHEIWKELGY